MITFEEYESAYQLFTSNYFLRTRPSRTLDLLRVIQVVRGRVLFRCKFGSRYWEILDKEGCYLTKTNAQTAANVSYLLCDTPQGIMANGGIFTCSITKEVKNFLRVISHPVIFSVPSETGYHVMCGDGKFRHFYYTELGFLRAIAIWKDEDIMTMVCHTDRVFENWIQAHPGEQRMYYRSPFAVAIKQFAKKHERFRTIATMMEL